MASVQEIGERAAASQGSGRIVYGLLIQGNLYQLVKTLAAGEMAISLAARAPLASMSIKSSCLAAGIACLLDTQDVARCGGCLVAG